MTALPGKEETMKATLKICLLFPIVLVFSCSGKKSPTESETPGFEGKIVTGSFTEAARQVISASGGTLSINNPSDPLNGLEITLPADGFSQDQEIIVSEAEITSHQRGTNFNPITPLIKISMGSGYSSDMITVKIPINLPDGHFAMGFFYDETTEKLEPIPVLRLESDFITLMTRHLSPDNATLMKGSLGINKTAVGNMVISSIQESLLDGQPVLSSGFLPGEDDWEFPNYGSYVCPGGHCAGQSMAAMWYYYEKKLGDEPALNARYDELNDPGRPGWFWEDNPRGYRFSSTIQKDQNFDNWVRSLEMQSWLPRISYYSFITAMLLTGEPQYVLIRNSATGSGHAMIVYKITPATGTLHIADPNFPDNMTRVIEYQNGQFKPYSSALVAGGSGTNFDQIGYAAKTSYVEWPLITARWAEFENGTIGDDRFPVYSIWAENGAGHALTDNFSTFDDTLIMHCRSASVPYMIPGTDKYQVFYVYDEQGNPLGSGSPYNNGVLRLHLKMGLNKLGFSIMGANVDAYDNYVDFRWIHVDRLEGNIQGLNRWVSRCCPSIRTGQTKTGKNYLTNCSPRHGSPMSNSAEMCSPAPIRPRETASG